jgi:hypothetical protein
LFVSALLLGSCARAEAEPASPGKAPGFAVVELFTSEGCSSCPPADAVLAELGREAARTMQPVHALSFHVDYWNRLGWRDPWSADWASARQRAYARSLSSRGVYTPQMIVNGRAEFIGSRREQARTSVASALARGAQRSLSLATKLEDGRLRADVRLDGAPQPNSLLQLAIVQRETTSDVTTGENEGRHLVHSNVVRAFSTTKLEHTLASVALPWPAGLPRDQAAVVAYVQDSESLAILAAARGDQP